MAARMSPRWRGFTLIELMIVVAIIGILAGISIPNFLRFQCRAKQSEAKGAMRGVFLTEQTYSGEFGTYLDMSGVTGWGGLDPTTITKAKYYQYTVTANASSFTGTAMDGLQAINVKRGANYDTWNVLSIGPILLNVKNGCD